MIYSDRLRLRAVERSDLPYFVTWLNDPQVRAGLTISLPLSLAEEEGWFEHMLSTPPPEHPLVIEILQAEGGYQPVGNCGFHQIDWRCRCADVGIFIGDRRYWNQGFGTEAMRLLLQHGFETLNLNRIGLRVHANNLGAVRAYEKAGFIHEGRLRQVEFQSGQYYDMLLMSVLRAEWLVDRGESP